MKIKEFFVKIWNWIKSLHIHIHSKKECDTEGFIIVDKDKKSKK